MTLIQKTHIYIAAAILGAIFLFGCSGTGIEEEPTSSHSNISEYEFPEKIDPAALYMFYLHGKIIEDQGIPAVSPDFGEYEYLTILEKLAENGFTVISEQRPKNTDVKTYAGVVAGQVEELLVAGVPAKNITVVGASKGAVIAVYTSSYLEDPEIVYVIMGICHPNNISDFIRGGVSLYGHVLSIYDESDELAGSCDGLVASSPGLAVSSHDEIVLQVGSGHGVLYKPVDEWVNPTIQWAVDHAR